MQKKIVFFCLMLGSTSSFAKVNIIFVNHSNKNVNVGYDFKCGQSNWNPQPSFNYTSGLNPLLPGGVIKTYLYGGTYGGGNCDSINGKFTINWGVSIANKVIDDNQACWIAVINSNGTKTFRQGCHTLDPLSLSSGWQKMSKPPSSFSANTYIAIKGNSAGNIVCTPAFNQLQFYSGENGYNVINSPGYVGECPFTTASRNSCAACYNQLYKPNK